MRKIFKKFGTSIGWTFVLLLTIASIASASEFGPRKKPAERTRPISVAEPAAILLLGAGLASLGLYAKKKRAKKP
jgi:hypothetical protein